ncbi:MAG: class I tRNA ligase family protein, partial [Thermodesulfobacteriota bacterium]|nr:class I tRNA ligase family protein [Thermodesulfobacteriota bacterium]
QGMVCKETQECPKHGYLYPHEVKDGHCVVCGGSVITGNTVKMSKSKKNVVDPQDLIDQYGADTVRMFCLFAAPPEKDLEWNDQGVEGSFRFLNRIWRLVVDHLNEVSSVPAYEGKDALSGPSKALHRKIHHTIKRVTEDVENRFHFNTAVSAVMELVNEVQQLLNSEGRKNDAVWSVIREAVETTVVLLSPIVPHITEELWQMLGHDQSLSEVRWPSFSEDALKAEKRLIVLQVNGKVRSKVEMPDSCNEEEIEAKALADERVQRFIDGKPVKKIIVVQKKLVNIVI